MRAALPSATAEISTGKATAERISAFGAVFVIKSTFFNRKSGFFNGKSGFFHRKLTGAGEPTTTSNLSEISLEITSHADNEAGSDLFGRGSIWPWILIWLWT